ncbi:phage tail terminator family protein [Clostridium perfringens]|uniref:phage tail terminator family protein n=1 Tax=Clostridium perfringens TaxID=1502 RepID=UPI0030D1E3E6
MVEIKSNTIVSAITRKLKDNFPEFNIYKDRKLQGLKKPCFFVFNLNSEQSKFNKDIFNRESLINVRFHSDYTRLDIDEIAFKLLDILSDIQNGELILRPIREITYEVTDGVLQMFIPYKIRVFKQSDNGVNMNTLESKGVIK